MGWKLADLPRKYQQQVQKELGHKPTTLPAEVAKNMTEKAFQDAVVAHAEASGWFCYHVFDSRKATKRGFPDLVLVRPKEGGVVNRALSTSVPFEQFLETIRTGRLASMKGGRVIFAELKKEGQYPKPEQRRWLTALALAGMEVHVWRPSDMVRICEALA